MSAVSTEDTVSRGGLSQVPQAAVQPSRRTARLSRSPLVEETALRAQLRVLAVLRGVAAFVQLAAIWTLAFVWNVELPLAPLYAAFAAVVALAGILAYRLRYSRPVTQSEFLAHLLCDIAWLSITLYWLGGSHHNPFVDLYIVYVGMAALVLSWRYAGVALAAALAAYALLQVYYVELRLPGGPANGVDFERIADTTEFVLLSAIVAYFGYRVSTVGRRHLRVAADAKERDVRKESALNLASLAAGAAHEMGTPLTTIAVLVGEMRRGGISGEEQRANLDAIWNAIQACKRSLGDMVVAVGADQLPEDRLQRAADFVREVIDRFRLMRPGVPVNLTALCDEGVALRTGATLRQSLLSLIVNAADVSPTAVDVVLRCEDDGLQIDILDRGPGIAPEVRQRLGAQPFTTKAGSGCGLGIFLANLNFARIGGRLDFLERDGGGTCARITLPVD
jgi:two-component system sensor histidine kinase RegB